MLNESRQCFCYMDDVLSPNLSMLTWGIQSSKEIFQTYRIFKTIEEQPKAI